MIRRSSRRRAGVSVLRRVAQLLLGLASRLDCLGEPNLVILGEKGVLPDVGEIEANEIFLVALDSLLRQRCLVLCPISRRAPAEANKPLGCYRAGHTSGNNSVPTTEAFVVLGS